MLHLCLYLQLENCNAVYFAHLPSPRVPKWAGARQSLLHQADVFAMILSQALPSFAQAFGQYDLH